MSLLDQLIAIEARARKSGRVRFVQGTQYPVSDRAFGEWLRQQAAGDWKVRKPKYVAFKVRRMQPALP